MEKEKVQLPLINGALVELFLCNVKSTHLPTIDTLLRHIKSMFYLLTYFPNTLRTNYRLMIIDVML